MAALKKAKLPNEPNLKMTFPAKTLAISHFHPFSKRVKTGKKVSVLCYFHAISDRLWVIYRSEIAVLRLWSRRLLRIQTKSNLETRPNHTKSR